MGRFSKSLPSHFSRSTAAGIPGSVACRASIRFFVAPYAQCQEVSRPEFTLTHSIRSFVHGRGGGGGSTEGRAGFVVIFITSRSCCPAVLRLVFMIITRRCCKFALENFGTIIITYFVRKKNLANCVTEFLCSRKIATASTKNI